MVTFPRPLFNYNISEMTFTPDAATQATVHGAGRHVTTSQTGDAGWGLSVTVKPLTDAERIGWRTWVASLRGGLKTFLAYDLRQSVPYAYRDGMPLVLGMPWDGVAGLSEAPEKHLLALTDLPDGFVITAGDYIGIREEIGGRVRYALATALADYTASETGALDVAIEPGLPSGLFSQDADIDFVQAKAEFIIPKSNVPIVSSADGQSFSFDALQVI